MEIPHKIKRESAYSSGILHFVDANSNYFDLLTADKFTRAGQELADLAAVLDYSTNRWLQNWLNESYGENEYCEVEPNWVDWLASRTQQSVSVNFLAKYQGNLLDHKYPESRQSWSKEEEEELVTEPEDELSSFIATAHAEDITQWSSLILDSLPLDRRTSFTWLKENVDLSPAQIYLGIILSDRFVIIKDDENDFYGGFSILLT